MVEYKTGNILDEDVEALVNTVNCVGFMGRRIERAMQDLPDVRTIVFEPHEAPDPVEPATARRVPGRQQIPSSKPSIPGQYQWNRS